MRRRGRQGFTLIEVLAAFAIALLLIVPIVRIIHGVAGSFAGLERSTERRVGMQAAIAAAMTAAPLKPGTTTIGDFTVNITPYEFERDRDLRRAGWRLYAVKVSKPGDGGRGLVVETLRLGRL